MTFSKLGLWVFMTGLLIGMPANDAWPDPAPRAVDQAVGGSKQQLQGQRVAVAGAAWLPLGQWW